MFFLWFNKLVDLLSSFIKQSFILIAKFWQQSFGSKTSLSCLLASTLPCPFQPPCSPQSLPSYIRNKILLLFLTLRLPTSTPHAPRPPCAF